MKADQTQRKLGVAVRHYRERLGISQEAFADKVSMHRTYYSAIERGEKNPTLRTLVRIAEGLGIHLAEILAEAGL